MILALDTATRTGWCHGVIGALPVWGHHDFGRNRSNGEVLAAFRAWLCGTIDRVQSNLICFESPYMPGPNSPFSSPANALTIRRLFAFAGFTEAVFGPPLSLLDARMPETRFYTTRTVLERLSISVEDLASLVSDGTLAKPARSGRYPADPVDRLYWERFYKRYPSSVRRSA